MLRSTLYRLNRDTISLESLGLHKVLIRIPQDTVIEVLALRLGPEGRQMARVFWQGKTLEVFAEDIERRGEVVRSALAAVGS
jgi:hypothetical protein